MQGYFKDTIELLMEINSLLDVHLCYCIVCISVFREFIYV